MKNFKVTKRLPKIDEIIEAHPLSEEGRTQVEKDRQEIKDILSGKDNRLLVVIGPCSAWPIEAVLKYARKFSELAPQVSDALKLVLRVYTNKPRTRTGWTGIVNQPNPFAPADIEEGLHLARKLMIKVIEMGLPIADEAFFTHDYPSFDLLSWAAVGARSTEDQEHRIYASALDCPVGMKNATSGTIESGINSVIAAQRSHATIWNGDQIETFGNPFAHLVLRGGINGPNYGQSFLQRAQHALIENGVKNPAILVDASHENSRRDGWKNPTVQVDVVNDALNSLETYPELRSTVKGFMIESFLKTGSYNLDELTSAAIDHEGLSITDACLGWEKTKSLILGLARKYNCLKT